jgi:hypothetical protein
MGEYMVIMIAVLVSVTVIGWGVYVRFLKTSYEDLREQEKVLKYAVTFWRYPDGGYVPQHKRMKLMNELKRVRRKLDDLHREDKPG